MFKNFEYIGALERIKTLEAEQDNFKERLSKLEQQTRMVIHPPSPAPRDFATAPLKEVLWAVLEHLNVDLKVIQPVAQGVKLVPSQRVNPTKEK